MRQIGTLPKTADARTFGDYLLSLGITSRVVESPDGWAVWVHNEDLVPKARAELEAYQKDPADPRYASAESAAREVRREAERRDREFRKNVRNLSGTWDRVHFRRRPLTVLLVAVCVSLFVAEQLSPGVRFWLNDHFWFFSYAAIRQQRDVMRGLDDIARGEVWRLITPAFLHGSVLHLVFNMWATLIEGTLIETRRGTRTLATLALLSAVASNVGQFLYDLFIYQALVPWVGISGVGYALFGYIWMKGRYEPEQGMIFTPNTVRVMILWLLLGFTGIMPMANGAHLVGLIVGVLFGLARF